MTIFRSSPDRVWALIAVSLGVFCVQLDAFAVNVALPRIGADFGSPSGALHWVFSAYLLAAGTFMLGAGRMGDVFGRRRLLVAGFVLFAAATLLCALAPSLPFLVVARVLQGAGGAPIMPAGLALLTNAFGPQTRTRALGYALGIGGTATAGGPFVGGLLTWAVSWRAVFWLSGVLAVLGALCARRAAESRDTSALGGLDWAGLTSGTAGLAAITVAVDRGRAWGWISGRSAIMLSLAVVLLTTFLWVERRAAFPWVEPSLFQNRRYVALTGAGAVANAATVVFLFVVPLSLQGRWGLPALAGGIAFLAPAIAMAVAGPVAGGVRPSRAAAIMAMCLGVGAAALFLAPLATRLPVYLATVTVGGGFLGVANALTLTATQAVIRPARAGEASGVTKTVITVAAGLGVVLAGPAADPGPGSVPAADNPMTAAGIACLVATLLLALWLPWVTVTRRRTTSDAPARTGSKWSRVTSVAHRDSDEHTDCP